MGMPNFNSRTIYRHDNLPVMQGMNSETIDLIATDPPFNKGRDFHATPDSLAAGSSFSDRWRWEKDVHDEWVDDIKDDYPAVWSVIETAKVAAGMDMAAFCCFMAVRLMEMKRILKPTGSIFLHCDHTASHYLRAAMDAVFGRKQFRNEIVWAYTGPNNTKRWFPRKHDVILFYVKNDKRAFFDRDAVRVPYSASFNTRRRYTEGSKGITAGYSDGRTSEEVSSTYGSGKAIEDWWTDIPAGGQISKAERTGYGTQKPLKLYERIIKAASKPGDIVLDPFAGCATTSIAAERLQRQWVGIDEWKGVYEMVLNRMDAEAAFMGVRPHIEYSEMPPIRTDAGEVGTPGFDTPASRLDILRPDWQRLTNPVMRWILGKAQSQQDGFGVCAGCGRRVPVEYMELDHIQPKSDKGRNYITNRILICATCNRQKGNKRTLDGLRADIKKSGWLEDLNAAKFSREKAFEVAEMVESQWDTPEVQAIVGEAKAAVAEQKRK